jgi:hypothetical protein
VKIGVSARFPKFEKRSDSFAGIRRDLKLCELGSANRHEFAFVQGDAPCSANELLATDLCGFREMLYFLAFATDLRYPPHSNGTAEI